MKMSLQYPALALIFCVSLYPATPGFGQYTDTAKPVTIPSARLPKTIESFGPEDSEELLETTTTIILQDYVEGNSLYQTTEQMPPSAMMPADAGKISDDKASID